MKSVTPLFNGWETDEGGSKLSHQSQASKKEPWWCMPSPGTPTLADSQVVLGAHRIPLKLWFAKSVVTVDKL